MRTNIDLQEDLLKEAGSYSQTTTKKDLVHEALATYVAVKKRDAQLIEYQEKMKAFRDRYPRIQVDVDTRDLIREDRDSH